MPRFYRRAPQRRPAPADLDADLRAELLFGAPLLGPGCVHRGILAQAWALHGETVLRDFIQCHPGRRPFAWWLLDHGKERPINPDVPEDVAARMQEQNTYYGYLHSSVIGKWGGRLTTFQEDETEYLERHRLLTRQEKQARAAQSVATAEVLDEANGVAVVLEPEGDSDVTALTVWLRGGSPDAT
jgi:hypothetical protein